MMNELAGQMSLFDFVASPQQATPEMTIEEKIIHYLFHDTKCVCDICGWYKEVEEAFYEDKDIVPIITSLFREAGDWSNTIFKEYTDLDFSELSHKRVGVIFKEGGIDINYDASAMDRKNWKHIRMNYRQVAEEVKKSILLHEKPHYLG